MNRRSDPSDSNPTAATPVLGATGHDDQDVQPWWRHGMVWLVIAGPAIVVVAGIVTVFIAAGGSDTVLDTSADRPALESRNHAATAGNKP